MSLEIRAFESRDWPAVWAILRAAIVKGDTYTFAPDAGEAEIRRAWVESPVGCFVAGDEAGEVVGTYFIRANQTGHGDHVGNCGYVVAEAARGRGVASQLCEHSQQIARGLGFLALQFNFVVSTNVGALRLWQRHGFDIVGTLPRAFRHPQAGLVDVHVLYKWLATDGDSAPVR